MFDCDPDLSNIFDYFCSLEVNTTRLRRDPLDLFPSYEEAKQLMQEFYDNPSLKWDKAYDDGCWARAHLICEALYLAGHCPHKAFALGPQADWHYHVAPALKVRMPDGHVDVVLLDPLSCTFVDDKTSEKRQIDALPTFDKWQDQRSENFHEIYLCEFGIPPKKVIEIPPYELFYHDFAPNEHSTNPNSTAIALHFLNHKL